MQKEGLFQRNQSYKRRVCSLQLLLFWGFLQWWKDLRSLIAVHLEGSLLGAASTLPTLEHVELVFDPELF